MSLILAHNERKKGRDQKKVSPKMKHVLAGLGGGRLRRLLRRRWGSLRASPHMASAAAVSTPEEERERRGRRT